MAGKRGGSQRACLSPRTDRPAAACARSRLRHRARHMVFGLPRSTAPKQPKRKAKRKRTDAKPFLDVAIEGLAAGHEHASEMGVYRHTGREVNGRGVWASVGHHAAYLFYSTMGSWCARLP
eukprot:scaffold77056_cov57-Phaeocystis_antarctica.AAC.3